MGFFSSFIARIHTAKAMDSFIDGLGGGNTFVGPDRPGFNTLPGTETFEQGFGTNAKFNQAQDDGEGAATVIQGGDQTLSGMNTAFDGPITMTEFKGDGAGSVTNLQRAANERDWLKAKAKEDPGGFLTAVSGAGTDIREPKELTGRMGLRELSEDKGMTEKQKIRNFIDELQRRFEYEDDSVLKMSGSQHIKADNKTKDEEDPWDSLARATSVFDINSAPDINGTFQKMFQIDGAVDTNAETPYTMAEKKEKELDRDKEKFFKHPQYLALKNEMMKSNETREIALRVEDYFREHPFEWPKDDSFLKGFAGEDLFRIAYNLTGGDRKKSTFELLGYGSTWSQDDTDNLGNDYPWMGIAYKDQSMLDNELFNLVDKEAKKSFNFTKKERKNKRKKVNVPKLPPQVTGKWIESETSSSEGDDETLLCRFQPLSSTIPINPEKDYISVYFEQASSDPNDQIRFHIDRVDCRNNTLGWLRHKIANWTDFKPQDVLLLNVDFNVLSNSNDSLRLLDAGLYPCSEVRLFHKKGFTLSRYDLHPELNDEALMREKIAKREYRARRFEKQKSNSYPGFNITFQQPFPLDLEEKIGIYKGKFFWWANATEERIASRFRANSKGSSVDLSSNPLMKQYDLREGSTSGVEMPETELLKLEGFEDFDLTQTPRNRTEVPWMKFPVKYHPNSSKRVVPTLPPTGIGFFSTDEEDNTNLEDTPKRKVKTKDYEDGDGLAIPDFGKRISNIDAEALMKKNSKRRSMVPTPMPTMHSMNTIDGSRNHMFDRKVSKMELLPLEERVKMLPGPGSGIRSISEFDRLFPEFVRRLGLERGYLRKYMNVMNENPWRKSKPPPPKTNALEFGPSWKPADDETKPNALSNLEKEISKQIRSDRDAKPFGKGFGADLKDKDEDVKSSSEESLEQALKGLKGETYNEQQEAYQQAWKKELGINLGGIEVAPPAADDQIDASSKLAYLRALRKAKDQSRMKLNAEMPDAAKKFTSGTAEGIVQKSGEDTEDVVEKMRFPKDIASTRMPWASFDDLKYVYRPKVQMQKRNQDIFDMDFG